MGKFEELYEELLNEYDAVMDGIERGLGIEFIKANRISDNEIHLEVRGKTTPEQVEKSVNFRAKRPITVTRKNPREGYTKEFILTIK